MHTLHHSSQTHVQSFSWAKRQCVQGSNFVMNITDMANDKKQIAVNDEIYLKPNSHFWLGIEFCKLAEIFA